MQITITTNIDDDKLPQLAEFLKNITGPVPQFVEPGVKPSKKAKAKAEEPKPVAEEAPVTEQVTKYPPEPVGIVLKEDITLEHDGEQKIFKAGVNTVQEMQELVNAGWTVSEKTAKENAEEPKNDLKALAEAQPISKTDLRAVALKLSKAGKADELAKIFADFGAQNLSSIKEADYPAVMERLVSVNA